jgi:hypothetical protein
LAENIEFWEREFGDAPAERFTRRSAAEAGAATAFSRAPGAVEPSQTSRPGESGVALRLPPQSKIAGALAHRLESPGQKRRAAFINPIIH